MANVQRQFEGFHEVIRTDYDTNSELRERRDIIIDKIESSLEKAGRSRFRRLLQGSYIMRTGVLPTADKEFDIDVGLHFEIDHENYTSVEVKQWVFDAIKHHTNNVMAKGPCIRVGYVAGYHVDLVCYASPQIGTCHLAHSDGWVAADPKALIEHVSNAQRVFSETEGGTQTTQLRRAIRYLKRWDDIWHPTEDDSKPSGLAYTILGIDLLEVARSYDGIPDDRQALLNLSSKVALLSRIVANKPTPLYEDLFARLKTDSMRSLIGRFARMHAVLEYSENEPDIVKACEALRAEFGDDFPIPSGIDSGVKTKAPAIVTSSTSG